MIDIAGAHPPAAKTGAQPGPGRSVHLSRRAATLPRHPPGRRAAGRHARGHSGEPRPNPAAQKRS